MLEAATRLFGECGWAGTGMRDVARAAGVAVETVYANFGSKPDLLAAALDVAVVGDDAPIALAERPEFAGIGQRLTPGACAVPLPALPVRSTSAPTCSARPCERRRRTTPTLAERLTQGENRRRINVEQAARLVAGRPVTDIERDGLWAV